VAVTVSVPVLYNVVISNWGKCSAVRVPAGKGKIVYKSLGDDGSSWNWRRRVRVSLGILATQTPLGNLAFIPLFRLRAKFISIELRYEIKPGKHSDPTTAVTYTRAGTFSRWGWGMGMAARYI
jgi:hypothetical protein